MKLFALRHRFARLLAFLGDARIEKEPAMSKFCAVVCVGLVAVVCNGRPAYAQGAASPDAFKNQTYPFSLPNLDYADNAFQYIPDPACFISEDTIITHHQGHHAGYVNRLNTLVNGSRFQTSKLEQIVLGAPEGELLANMAVAHYNHSFYWNTLTPTLDLAVPEPLYSYLVRDFGSVEAFKTEFGNAAKRLRSLRGSGSVWLVAKRNEGRGAGGRGKGNVGGQAGRFSLQIVEMDAFQTPIRDSGSVPLYMIDVWEHAYYLDRRNLAGDYVDCAIRLVNWHTPNRLLEPLFY